MNPESNKAPPPIIWWVIWGAITSGLIVVYLLLRSPTSTPLAGNLRYLPAAPLCLACLVRWLGLPRFSGAQAFPVFVIGLALAEASGILGIFLVPTLKETYFFLSLGALGLFAPLFLTREKATHSRGQIEI